jgi:hypothetical protein
MYIYIHEYVYIYIHTHAMDPKVYISSTILLKLKHIRKCMYIYKTIQINAYT